MFFSTRESKFRVVENDEMKGKQILKQKTILASETEINHGQKRRIARTTLLWLYQTVLSFLTKHYIHFCEYGTKSSLKMTALLMLRKLPNGENSTNWTLNARSSHTSLLSKKRASQGQHHAIVQRLAKKDHFKRSARKDDLLCYKFVK